MLPLRVESWIWYGFAIFVVSCRFVSRSLLFGSPLHLKIDDFIMVFAVLTYTSLLINMNIVANKNSNLLPPGVSVSNMSQADIDDRILGSKITLVVEQMQISTIWTLKTTLIIMYYRLTFQLPQNRIVKILAGYVAFGFVLMEILYFGVWCRPFHNYWAVPTPNPQCDAATNHLITNAVLNISSDLIMLGIGFSLALKSKLPWKRRVIVHAIFALGIFVIIAAVLNKYYSFTNPFGSLWTFWYIREASTAMIVANLPFCWTLIRRVFNVGSFSGDETTSQVKYHSSRSARGRRVQTSGRQGIRPVVVQGESLSNQSTDSGGSVTRKDTSMDSDKHWARGGVASPMSEQRTHIEPIAPSVKRWRERGVYGKEDIEALGSDIEEVEEPIELTTSTARPPHRDGVDHGRYTDLVLNDVGNLGDPVIPSVLPTPPDSPIPPSPSTQNRYSYTSYQQHRRTPSDLQSESSGRHSPEMRRPGSAMSGAPETVASPRSSVQVSRQREQRENRPVYYSGRSRAINKRLSGDYYAR